MFFDKSFKNQIKYTVIISGIGLIIVFGLLYISINRFAVNQEISKARLLSDTVIDFRSYMAKVAPNIIIQNKKLSPFSCTPTYVVNQVSKSLKRQKNFLLRQVSDKYRNVLDKPTPTEMRAIEFFKTHKKADEFWEIHSPHGKNKIYEEKHIFYAKPLYITKSCMKCHGDPKKDVPPRLYKLLVKHYGNRAFNCHIGDLRGIMSVVIPYNGVIHTINSIFLIIALIITLFYILGAILFYEITKYVESSINDILATFDIDENRKIKLINKKFKLSEFENLKNKINLTFNKINDYQKRLYDKLYKNDISLLPNRNKFFEDFKDGVKPIAIIDMDKFKDINILFGIKIADELVKQSAERLKELSTKYDYNLYHLDIDKFALVFNKKNIEKNDMDKIVKDIISCLEKDYNIDDNQIVVKFRAGVSLTKKEYILAELAQNKAKELRKDVVCCSEITNLKNAYEDNLKIFSELKEAVKNDRIIPYFQPITDRNKKIKKYESLVRMIDSNGNIVSPFKFLDIAKKTRIYEEITKRVIKKAFEKFNNKEYWVSINLDLYDLETCEMRKYILKMLNQYNVKAIFEIVESEEVEESPELMSFLSKLQENGAKIYIDDFGSGYANFDYLLKLHPNGVKIDGSLIKNILTNKNNELIVQSIIDFAHNVNMEVVAEFIENEEIFDKLRKMGVDSFQGYYFSPPKPDIEGDV